MKEIAKQIKVKKVIMKVNRDKTRQHYFGVLNIQTEQEELIRFNLRWHKQYD